ncbi:MAG: ABC-type transport auxiliary lipoprotein family protein [Rhodospirillaceae bacterium]|nr:ABC-type transport auxiliary lipoprotein family protein [Rhodospirillaceae bacterium]MDD9925060.1 ABC-type transport auxiliary lipoprotein family protein [Rhodospirillaceae bacterium]
MKMSISRRIVGARWMGAVALLGLVSACSLELPGTGAPPRMYVLTPKSTFSDTLPSVDWQLLVEVPQAQAGINTARIALRDSPIEMRYFELSNWTDLAPRMIQTLIVESFENSDRIVAVGREAIGLRADYVLKTELREFQAEFAQRLPDSNEGGIGNVAPPTIRVRINAKLIKMPRRSIVASKNFEYLIEAKENSMAEIIGAFDTALGKTMRRMVEWTLTIGEKNDDPRDKAARRRQ